MLSWLVAAVTGPALLLGGVTPVAGPTRAPDRLARRRAVQRPDRQRARAVRPGPAGGPGRRPGARRLDGPAGGVLLRDALDRAGAAPRAPARGPRPGGRRRPVRAVGVGAGAAPRARHQHPAAQLRAGLRPLLPGYDGQPARQVRDDLAVRPGRGRRDGRVDELHRLRRRPAVAGPLRRARRPPAVPAVPDPVPGDAARRAAGPARAAVGRPRAAHRRGAVAGHRPAGPAAVPGALPRGRARHRLARPHRAAGLDARVERRARRGRWPAGSPSCARRAATCGCSRASASAGRSARS